MLLRGTGEFPLRRRKFFGIFTACRFDVGTALMPIVTSSEQLLPLPVIATHQAKLPLPVIIIPKDQVPVNLIVESKRNNTTQEIRAKLDGTIDYIHDKEVRPTQIFITL